MPVKPSKSQDLADPHKPPSIYDSVSIEEEHTPKPKPRTTCGLILSKSILEGYVGSLVSILYASNSTTIPNQNLSP